MFHLFPILSSARCGNAQERLAAKKAAKREKMRKMKRRLAKAKREAEAEARKMQKAKKKKMFAQKVCMLLVLALVGALGGHYSFRKL